MSTAEAVVDCVGLVVAAGLFGFLAWVIMRMEP
jgi:flagellar biogenesis protein FliO